jgi:hypothetical protein
MSDSATTAAGETATDSTTDSPLGLRWYHWLLVVGLAVAQLPGTEATTAAGTAGALVGAGAGSLLVIYFLTAGVRKLS